MFDLICRIEANRNYDYHEIRLIESGLLNKGNHQIPEDANLSFELILNDKNNSLGTPYMLIGDIPLGLIQSDGSAREGTLWVSEFINPYSGFREKIGQPFSNNVGVSEFVIRFTSSNKVYRVTIDILATKENERLSEEMLDHLSKRFSDAVNLCFSRTMIGAGNSKEMTETNISRLIREAEKGISSIETSWPIFSGQIRTVSERNIVIQRGGIPDSPEGIVWLSQNQSNIVFCDASEQTLKINNLPAKLIDGATEVVNDNANIRENLVILSYLLHIQQKLKGIKGKLELEKSAKVGVKLEYLDYVSLDNIVSRYKEPVIRELINSVDNLEKRAVTLYRNLAKIMDKKTPPSFYPPIMTPFVVKNVHYRRIYTSIYDWYNLGDVVFTDTELFYGLRSLTKIYEFCCLVMILDSFVGLEFTVNQQEWRDYTVKGFGGSSGQRPVNWPNNYFVVSNDYCEIEIYYEPKIWRKCNSNAGDPIVVLAKHEHIVDHYLSPDFLLNINWKSNKSNDLLIFDAKYSPASSVRDYAIDKLINRYFFGIHQIGKDGNMGRLPIQAVWALYPKRGKNVVSPSFYASEHCLGGSSPLLPSLGGMSLKPSKQSIFKNQLSLLMKKLAE